MENLGFRLLSFDKQLLIDQRENFVTFHLILRMFHDEITAK